MEALIFLFDSLIMLLVLYMGLVDDRRTPTQLLTSLFRESPGDGSAEPERDPRKMGVNQRGRNRRR